MSNTIDDPRTLRAHYGDPSERARKKQLARLDRHCRKFIAAAPFVLIASSGAEGSCDCSPKGDAPGFVAVIDDRRGLTIEGVPIELVATPPEAFGTALVRATGSAAYVAALGPLPRAASEHEVYAQLGRPCWNRVGHRPLVALASVE